MKGLWPLEWQSSPHAVQIPPRSWLSGYTLDKQQSKIMKYRYITRKIAACGFETAWGRVNNYNILNSTWNQTWQFFKEYCSIYHKWFICTYYNYYYVLNICPPFTKITSLPSCNYVSSLLCFSGMGMGRTIWSQQ